MILNADDRRDLADIHRKAAGSDAGFAEFAANVAASVDAAAGDPAPLAVGPTRELTASLRRKAESVLRKWEPIYENAAPSLGADERLRDFVCSVAYAREAANEAVEVAAGARNLRKTVLSLPSTVLELLQDRHRRGGISKTEFIQEVSHAEPGRFARLLTQHLTRGGKIVPGRMRPTGRRSAPRLESAIGPALRPRGRARVIDDRKLCLIAYLAIDFTKATGKRLPISGHGAFVDLVAFAFDRLGWRGIDHHLKTYLRSQSRLRRDRQPDQIVTPNPPL